MTDRIDVAIAAAEQPPAVPTAQLRVVLPSGRAVILVVPADLTAPEAVALVGFIGTQLGAELAKGRPGPRLLVPTHAIARS